MSIHQIHIFISHSWAYSNHYDALANWIFNENWSVGQASLNFQDFSVPKNDPIHNAINDTQLRNAIYNKIARSHIIVIPTGMYAEYSKWIGKEIDGANQYSKPILAINPWAQERKSSTVINNATEIVGWNKQTIINSLWKLYSA